MKVVAQRVECAEVRVDGESTGRIGRGLLLLVGFGPDDTEEELRWMAEKIRGLRVFSDEEDRMNLDLSDVGGALLVVSQFTLYGDVSKGRRPSFVGAAPPGRARELYDRFLELCAEDGTRVESGEFGAMMDVELVNAGPVTLIVER
ncbi:MAG: D-aminoacyl-tRNA deacylase [Gemmatimonadota bacterium]